MYLEAFSNYTFDGFIAAYRRFLARRGIPHTLYSDCGTTFIGANAALKKMFILFNKEHRAISTEYQLRRTIGEVLLTIEVLITLLTQIEVILNSQPLEPLVTTPMTSPC